MERVPNAKNVLANLDEDFKDALKDVLSKLVEEVRESLGKLDEGKPGVNEDTKERLECAEERIESLEEHLKELTNTVKRLKDKIKSLEGRRVTEL